MTEIPVTMLYPHNISPAWPHIEQVLKPAVELAGTHEMEDVRKDLVSGRAQLWVQWSDGCDAAVVTELVPYPKGLWLRVWLMGAKGEKDVEWNNFENAIIKFAYVNKCQNIELWGRNGWEKRYPQANKELVILRLPLDEGVKQ